MKILKPRTLVLFGLVALTGVVLLHTSQNAQNAEKRLNMLQAEVDQEEERIRILKAEWAHLNRPERLERLAQEFLSLNPSTPSHMLSDAPSLPAPVQEDIEQQEAQAVSYDGAKPLPKPFAKPTFIKKPLPPQAVVEEPPTPIKSKEATKDFGALLGEITSGNKEGAQ